MIGIYKVTYIPENKVVYVGQSINVEDRFKQHKYCYNNPNELGYKSHFYRTLRKYGFENFHFELIEECLAEQLDEREIYWIAYFDTFKHRCNSTERGQHMAARCLNEEEIKELKQDLKENKLSYNEMSHKYSVSNLFISQINKGLIYTEEQNLPLREKSSKDYPIRKKNHCKICGAEILNESTLCWSCYSKEQLKKNSNLSIEDAIALLKENNRNFESVGRQVGVNGNAIRRRLKEAGLPFHSSDYQKPKEKKEKGYNPPPKRCAKLDEEGNFLEVYPSVRNAEKIYNAPGCISRVCNNRRPAYHGFKWRIISEEEYQNSLAK